MMRKYLLLLFFCVTCFSGMAQSMFANNIVPELNLEKQWAFHEGDDKEWASPSFDDKGWDTVTLGREENIGHLKFKGIGWFRLHFMVPPQLRNKNLVMVVAQYGASDVYLNGDLLQSFGKVGNLQTEVPFNPEQEIHYIQLDADSVQCLAVRFSGFKVMKSRFIGPFFTINVYSPNVVNDIGTSAKTLAGFSILFFAIFFTVCMFHLLLFLYYRKVRSNLYYSILALLLAIFWLYPYLNYSSPNPLFCSFINEINFYIFGLSFFLIVVLLYSIFKEKYNWFFWVLAGLTLVTLISPRLNMNVYAFAIFTQITLASVKGIAMVIKAVRHKQAGAKIIAVGFVIFLSMVLFMFLLIAYSALSSQRTDIRDSTSLGLIASLVWALSIPTSMSVYLASDFSRTNKKLALQLVHVHQLSEQNIQKEREKQQIIEGQKQELEIKVKEATAEISRKKDDLSEKNKEITDSINYARRIQTSLLPEDDILKEALGEYMVIYKPKDVVSGDFYWCHAMGDKVVFAVADCTGHGVPGAFMSMIGNSLLNGLIKGRELTEASIILDELRSHLVVTLQQSAQHITTRDGMDIALCVWDKKTNILQFSGANNSLYLVSRDIAINGTVKESARVKLGNDHLLEILPDKQPIGYQEDKMNNPFTKNIIQLRKGDTVFIASDGFVDQFGGAKNKKYTSKRFRELIASLVGLPLAEQQVLLDKTIEDWKSNESQTDDICVMGVRI